MNETLDLNDSTFNGTLNTENKQTDKSLKPECEIERNGLKLSPKGRYQVSIEFKIFIFITKI